MTYIGLSIFIFGVVRMIISLINWLSPVYLSSEESMDRPLVSILIPARNEEKNIGNLLTDLSRLKYPYLEVWVYNDLSSDRTVDIIKEFSLTYPYIKLINGEEPPKGWVGKNYACHQLATYAKGEMLLFLDADVRVEDGIIEKSLSYMEKYQLKLLSVFPKQIMPGIGSLLAVPLMNWILLSLLLLLLVRISPWPVFSAANGQFMFFEAETYRKLLPHALCKSNQVEDIAILKTYKKHKLKSATLLGTSSDICCRMYSTLKESVEGFSKNVFHFFGGSKLLTCCFGFIIFLSPFYLFMCEWYGWGILYLGIVFFNHLFVSLASKQSIFWNTVLLLPQQLIFWRIIMKALQSYRKKQIIWKDRSIYPAS